MGIFAPLYQSLTIRPGAIWILLAYALYFPHRPILMMFVFPVPAKYFVMIMGGMSLLASLSANAVASRIRRTWAASRLATSSKPRMNVKAEIHTNVKWRINRMRRKFDVYPRTRKRNQPPRALELRRLTEVTVSQEERSNRGRTEDEAVRLVGAHSAAATM